MNKSRILILLFFNLILATSIFAQDDFVNAEQAFTDGKFADALDYYKKSFVRCSGDRVKQAEITFKMARTYHKLGLRSEAELWYRRAIIVKYPDPIAEYYYAEMLRLNQKFDAAAEEYKKYAELVPSDPRGQKGIDLCTNTDKNKVQAQNIQNSSNTKSGEPSEKNQTTDNSQAQSQSTADKTSAKSEHKQIDRTLSHKIDSCKNIIAKLEITGDKKELALAYNDLANNYYYSGDNNAAIDYYNQSLKKKEELGDKQGISTALVNLGIIYNNSFRYEEAVKCFQKSLKLKQDVDDKAGESKLLHRIASVYYENKYFEKAAAYSAKTLELDKTLKNDKDIAVSSNNLGVMLYELKSYDKSVEQLEASLKINKTLGQDKEASIALNNLGNIKYDLKKYDEALGYYAQSLAIKEKIDYKKGEAITLYNFGNVYNGLNQLAKAKEYFQRCEKISTENNFFDVLYGTYIALSDIYSAERNCEKSFAYFKLADPLKRLAGNYRKNKPMSELQIKYDPDGLKDSEEISLLSEEITKQKLLVQEMNERREMETELSNAELEKKESELTTQKTQKYASVVGLLFVLVIAFLLLRGFKIKKKQNEIINLKNEELQQQKEEIIVQRDLVTSQKEKIEEIYSDLTDSIHYAERIQKAILPSHDHIAEIINSCRNSIDSYFILFKPRDIVSGDFCFFEKRKNMILMAVADCTGHGVPGAFMSMLGLTFLNEIIAKEHIKTASQVLDELRDHIIHSLQQKGITGEQKDGMDITFVAFDTDTKIIQFSGANNPLWIVKPNLETPQQPEFTEVKPDKMPVAIYEKMNPFTNHTIQLQKGDIIYLASDGYEDQFGGPKGKKFLSKKFKIFLSEISTNSLDEQRNKLDTTIEEWKNMYAEKYEQTDDITIMGIKVS